MLGPDCDDQKNNQLLLDELSGIPLEQRTARYHCTIVYLQNYDHPVPRIYNSSWEGLIGLKR